MKVIRSPRAIVILTISTIVVAAALLFFISGIKVDHHASTTNSTAASGSSLSFPEAIETSSPESGLNDLNFSSENSYNKENSSSLAENSVNFSTIDKHISYIRHPVRIAFVKQSFTVAAYSYWSGGNSFYKFFRTHDSTRPGSNVTENLQWLTSPPIAKLNETRLLSPVRVYPMLTLVNDLMNQSKFYRIQIIDDIAVHKGKIFFANGTNVFDVLILGHQEYVTQSEYENLKRFVSDGGTLVSLDSNIFYAEVRYNETSDSVTLVRGHSWAYNGVSAWRDVNERWGQDIASWIGGKTFVCSKCEDGVYSNNPFNYSDFEQQYVANPNDQIILDYKYSNPSFKIATYELNFGKGSVYIFGIYSDHVIRNAKFIGFFNKIILEAASQRLDTSN